MKTKLPYGHPDTLPTGPFPCKGDEFAGLGSRLSKYHPRQRAWMEENKPLYYSGILMNDLPHMPAHLRSL
jgi:hypothetical protein